MLKTFDPSIDASKGVRTFVVVGIVNPTSLQSLDLNVAADDRSIQNPTLFKHELRFFFN